MALLITLKIIPASGRIAWVCDQNQRIKLYVKSPAQQGRANNEVVKIIAQVLGVPQTAVQIITGATSPLKRIKIETPLSLQEFCKRVGLDMQQLCFDQLNKRS